MQCMECRNPTSITVDGKCVSCFLSIRSVMRQNIVSSGLTLTVKGREILRQHGIKPEDVRVVDVEEV